MEELSLGGTWSFKRTDTSDWLSGEVPGSLLTDLLRLGQIPEPTYRDHEEALLERFEADYEYKKTFVLPTEILSYDRLLVRFEGLDTLCEITFNGQLLGQTDNMHRTYEFDILPWTKAGDNTLHIRFFSCLRFIRDAQDTSPLWGIPMTIAGFPHLRKAHYMLGWDWGPQLPDCGIWREVKLIALRHARIRDVRFDQQHIKQNVTVDCTVDLERYGDSPLQVELQMTEPLGRQWNMVLPASDTPVQFRIDIANPKLWWPRSYGEQPLYECRLIVRNVDEVVEERTYSIGMRTLTVNREDDEWGRAFAFQVNGVSIFAMGACYIPEDNLIGRCSPQRTEQLIQDCLDANFNCIRVWGGGYYPSDHFYELCDRVGLIVWQDLMFACAVYELSDRFEQTVLSEIGENLQRIRHHASLGLICGNNELEMFWADGRFPENEKHRRDYLRLFEELIPSVVSEICPQLFYWPSSPSSEGGFQAPNGEKSGNGHYWAVWHSNKPFTEYRNTYYRFMSEFGFESLPHLRTIESFTEPSDRNMFSRIMELHQKNPDGNQKILSYLSETFLYPKDFASLVYASQMLQAEAMRYGVEHWRRHRGRCMGTLYWQLNDCYPASSWSSIDYAGRWKALHYAARRFFTPVLASVKEADTSAQLHVTNETMQAFQGTLQWSLNRTDGSIVDHGEQAVLVASLKSDLLISLQLEPQLKGRWKYSTYLHYRLIDLSGHIVSEGTTLFVKPKHFEWQLPQWTASVYVLDDELYVELKSDQYAKFVCLELEGLDAVFSDNYFDLTPHAPRKVRIGQLPGPWDPKALGELLRIRSCADLA